MSGIGTIKPLFSLSGGKVALWLRPKQKQKERGPKTAQVRAETAAAALTLATANLPLDSVWSALLYDTGKAQGCEGSVRLR